MSSKEGQLVKVGVQVALIGGFGYLIYKMINASSSDSPSRFDEDAKKVYDAVPALDRVGNAENSVKDLAESALKNIGEGNFLDAGNDALGILGRAIPAGFFIMAGDTKNSDENRIFFAVDGVASLGMPWLRAIDFWMPGAKFEYKSQLAEKCSHMIRDNPLLINDFNSTTRDFNWYSATLALSPCLAKDDLFQKYSNMPYEAAVQDSLERYVGKPAPENMKYTDIIPKLGDVIDFKALNSKDGANRLFSRFRPEQKSRLEQYKEVFSTIKGWFD